MDRLRQSRRCAVGAATVLVAALVSAIPASGVGVRADGDPPEFRGDHGTRPTRLRAPEVTRIAAAFGIGARPTRTGSDWEAEDETRSLYLWRAPSAWYLQFEDASVLVQPPADRAAVCDGTDPPHACVDPEAQFVADTLAEAPSADAALDAARDLLEGAGLVDDRWDAFVAEPTRLPIPCRPGLTAVYDCNRQRVATRAVHFDRSLAPGTTHLRIGVVVGPGPAVYLATGRVLARAE